MKAIKGCDMQRYFTPNVTIAHGSLCQVSLYILMHRHVQKVQTHVEWNHRYESYCYREVREALVLGILK
jgi:hypothetical protein